jgi:hypothetical protein
MIQKRDLRFFSALFGPPKWGVAETLPAMVIAHNAPFDLGALALRAGPSRGDNYGGLTLYLQKKRPGLAIRKIGCGKHFYKANQSRNERRNHRFIDTMQLGRALLSS